MILSSSSIFIILSIFCAWNGGLFILFRSQHVPVTFHQLRARRYNCKEANEKSFPVIKAAAMDKKKEFLQKSCEAGERNLRDLVESKRWPTSHNTLQRIIKRKKEEKFGYQKWILNWPFICLAVKTKFGEVPSWKAHTWSLHQRLEKLKKTTIFIIICSDKKNLTRLLKYSVSEIFCEYLRVVFLSELALFYTELINPWVV